MGQQQTKSGYLIREQRAIHFLAFTMVDFPLAESHFVDSAVFLRSCETRLVGVFSTTS
ncbi:MAG: hypothetical protein ACI9IP_000240 [Arcticibacterium sp.]|jgi:hypothetical protein